MKNLKIVWATCLLFITVTVAAQNEKDKKIMADAEKAKATLIEKDAGIRKFSRIHQAMLFFQMLVKAD